MTKNLHMKIYLPLALCLLCACSGQPKQTDATQLKQLVHEANQRLGKFFELGNADSLAGMYTVGAKLCPNGTDFVTGREQIRAFWKKDLSSGAKILEMRTETFTVDGTPEVVYETGKTFLKIAEKDSTYHSSVKYCNIWRRQPNGSYQLDVDIWNKLP
jgi:ketosteroid isomerase-like protein